MNDTAFLQKLIDSRTGIVTIPDGNYLITESLLVSDHTHIIASPGAHFRLEDHANCPILRSRYKEDHAMTVDVTIEGGIWDGNNLNQDRELYHTEGGQPERGPLMWFSSMSRFRLAHLTLKDPDSYGVLMTDVEYFTVEDIYMDYNKATLNEDGIHIDGWARHGHITNIKGDGNDDLVALNSDEGLPYSPDNDIEDITIDGLYGGDDGWTAVRLLSRHANVRNICIRNIYGKYKFNIVSFTHWAKEPGDYGYFDNIVIENMFGTSCRTYGSGHGGLIWFQPEVRHAGHVVIRNYLRTEAPEFQDSTNIIEIGESVHIRQLIVDNLTQDVPNDKPLVAVGKNITIDEMRWDGRQTDPAALPLKE